MKKLSPTFFFLILCLLFSRLEARVKTIHAILIADNVHDITNITQADLFNIQNEVRVISQHSETVLKEKTFIGREFQKEKVVDYLTNLQIDPIDTVIFYFSGHGYRTLKKENQWPYLSFELYKIGLDMQWVADTIWNKNPQFALIVGDCCNNYAERGITREKKYIQINLHKKTPRYSGYKKLFTKAKGCVVVCSCSKGQYSYGSECGGIFSLCFLSSLNKEIAEPSPSWKNLLLRASSYMEHIQKPICQIYR